MTNTQYNIAPSPHNPQRWAILNAATNEVVEAGFSTRNAALDCMYREYNAVTAWWRATP